ncbi:MAG: hypothetical protein KJZ59_08850 [Pararhodobacter sp.]|nr:hypothetical protein [Pararhodobacter sp.]
MDYGKSGAPKRKTKEPRNPYDKSGKAPDKGELLARMKAAATKAKGDEDPRPKG